MATSLSLENHAVQAKYLLPASNLSNHNNPAVASSSLFGSMMQGGSVMMDGVNNDTLAALLTTPAAPSGPQAYDYDSVRYLRFYSLGIIIPVGIISNILSIFVFTRSFMSRSTTGHYLISLAFADMSLLIGEFLSWLNSIASTGEILGLNFMHTADFWCRGVQYLRYAGRIWSSWLTVIITVERFITIAFPLKVSRISTPTKAKVVILIEILASFLITSFPLFTLRVKPLSVNSTVLRCQIMNPPDHEPYETFMWVVIRGGELVCPSVIVCVFTLLIIVKLAQAGRERRKQFEGQASLKSTKRGSSHERQLTIILVAVAITFVVIRLPYTVTFYINEYKEELWEPLDKWFSFRIYVVNSVAQVLAVVNYAINFFLYCMCGSTFRRELWKAFGCRPQKGVNRNHTTLTTASPSPSRKGETKL